MDTAEPLGGSTTDGKQCAAAKSPSPLVAQHSEAIQAGSRQLDLLDRLLRDGSLGTEHFAPSFLAQVPAAKVAEIVAELRQRCGDFHGVALEGEVFILRLDRAEVPTLLVLDQEGRIAGLLFQAPVPTTGNLGDYVRAISALPGQTAVLVTTDGRIRADHQADVPLAVGSAFKLAVLRAVGDAVADGRLAWDQVVRLDRGWRSLPSGILQDWPDCAPLTAATLANLMISISDNTATDALIHVVGRAAVEAVSPRNTPFLTTREAWVLKTTANASLRQAWLAANGAARRTMLGVVDAQPRPTVREIAPEVTSGVEWFLTARELCALLDATRDMPAFQINPGPLERSRWESVAYKGGSEAGVFALTASVVAKTGARHCVVATWNSDNALDEQHLLEPFNGILRDLASAR